MFTQADGSTILFPVVTGQKRVVRYIGRTYNATTPERTWMVLSEDTKGDHTTFGPTGRFLRLSDNEDGSPTPYGIHGHASAERMLDSTDRYRSMGCIIVSEWVLDMLETAFRKNDYQLQVITSYGLNTNVTQAPVGIGHE